MNFISQFFSPPLSEKHQTYFDKLPEETKSVMKTKPIKDQEKLLETFSKQSDERILLICRILDQQSRPILEELFTKEIRLLNALIKVDTCYLEDVVSKPDYIANSLKKRQP